MKKSIAGFEKAIQYNDIDSVGEIIECLGEVSVLMFKDKSLKIGSATPIKPGDWFVLFEDHFKF